MMMMPDKKKMVSIILSGLARTPSASERAKGFDVPKESVEGSQDDKSTALQDAATKIIKAVKAEDADMLIGYLKDFIYLCGHDEDDGYEEGNDKE